MFKGRVNPNLHPASLLGFSADVVIIDDLAPVQDLQAERRELLQDRKMRSKERDLDRRRKRRDKRSQAY